MRLCTFGAGLLALAVAGCSSDNTAARVAELNKKNIQKTANLYATYQMHNGMVGPKDLANLKEFVSSGIGLSPHRLELMQIDPKNLDHIFISERDHKPFRLKPSVQAVPRTIVAVVFEDTGIDGKRQVGFDNSSIQEVDDAKYKELWESKEPSAKSIPVSEAEKGGG